MGIKVVPKVQVTDKQSLSVVYTPGVAASCLETVKNEENSYNYTNRENFVGVFSFDYEKSLKRAEFLKLSLGIDAIPFEIEKCSKDDIKFIIENLECTFGGIDLSLISDEVKDIDFKAGIPVLKGVVSDLKEFFLCVSKNLFMFDMNKLKGDLSERSLTLRQMAGGVIETEITTEKHIKPVGIITDGSAVLGLGNIGALASIPVMEGKSALFASFAEISAVPVCIKTQEINEIVKLITMIKNSFSAINLEDISAPRCFEVEKELRNKLDINVFHDDAHGTSIVVTAGIINALKVVGKKIDKVKAVISGAGAAGTTIGKLLLHAGLKNLIMCDKFGAINKDDEYSQENHRELAKITNPHNEKGKIEDVIEGADVFIGVSAGSILKKEDVEKMSDKPIVFALANPIPEIMPEEAEEAGAYIVATGRSDYKNQINNCLAFPGIFKGILKYGVKEITDEIKLNCAKKLAETISSDKLNKDYIIPDSFDSRVVETVSEGVCL